jgi:hypothetical protein
LSHCCFDLHFFDLFGEMDENGLTEFLAQFFKVPDCEVNVFVLWTTERALQSVNITVFELFGEDSSGRDLLFVGVDKAAVLEGKAFEELADQKGELFAFAGVELIMGSINECVFFHGMSMEVAIQVNIALFEEIGDEFFEVVDFGVKVFGGIFPFFVKVIATDVGAVVAVNDTIRVDHGYDFEYEVLA